MLYKYPRTPHIAGSRQQPGDSDLPFAPFSVLAGKNVVVEEKVDGANCALSFKGAQLQLQSRGHFLTGGPRERHFALPKQWAHTHQHTLADILTDRYVCYGEWLYAKHTVFYDSLPHYFMEFDILDSRTGRFLDTERRHELLRSLPIVPVRVLFRGLLRDPSQLRSLLTDSAFKTRNCSQALRDSAERLGLDPEEIASQTDPSPSMEGLYIKVEEEGVVTARYKFVRHDFLTRIVDAESHWLARPIVPNLLAPGVDIFASNASQETTP
jgi:hypothetical protein